MRLAEHGMVTVAPQFGTFVAAIDPDEVRQAQFMREHLEVAVARRLCGVADLDLTPAWELVRRQRAMVPTTDVVGFTALDDAMHAWLFAAAGMDRVWAAIHAKKAHLDRVRFLHVPEPGKSEEVAEQHTRILEAIAAGDRDRTERNVREHVSGSLVYLERLMVDRPELFERPKLSRVRAVAEEEGAAGSAPAGKPPTRGAGRQGRHAP